MIPLSHYRAMAQNHRRLAEKASNRAIAKLHLEEAERWDGKARKARLQLPDN